MTDVTNVALTLARQRLVEVMQEIRYGRLEGLKVRDWEPVLGATLWVVRHFVFGRDNELHTARNRDGFALKKSVAEFFDIFDPEASS